MNEQWPPAAPELNKQFEQGHEGQQEKAADKGDNAAVTKSQIEALEQQNRKTAPQLNLNPPGLRPATVNRARLERIEKMKQRLQNNEGKAREDFGRSAGRER